MGVYARREEEPSGGEGVGCGVPVLALLTFISANPAGLIPQRSATRIMRSLCLPSSLGVTSGSSSGKKISQAAFSLVMKLVSGVGSGAVAAMPGFIWYLIELPTAAAADAGKGICICCCERAAGESLRSDAGKACFAAAIAAPRR